MDGVTRVPSACLPERRKEGQRDCSKVDPRSSCITPNVGCGTNLARSGRNAALLCAARALPTAVRRCLVPGRSNICCFHSMLLSYLAPTLFCRPVHRTWRKDVDGTYIVLFQVMMAAFCR